MYTHKINLNINIHKISYHARIYQSDKRVCLVRILRLGIVKIINLSHRVDIFHVFFFFFYTFNIGGDANFRERVIVVVGLCRIGYIMTATLDRYWTLVWTLLRHRSYVRRVRVLNAVLCAFA